eukprot:1157286-Pelagomonas_calceolata.AAC.1
MLPGTTSMGGSSDRIPRAMTDLAVPLHAWVGMLTGSPTQLLPMHSLCPPAACNSNATNAGVYCAQQQCLLDQVLANHSSQGQGALRTTARVKGVIPKALCSHQGREQEDIEKCLYECWKIMAASTSAGGMGKCMQ